MSDTQTNDQTEHQPNIRSLREAAEAGAQAQKELAEARREMLFLRAGIDTSTKIGGLLYKTWEGDDANALKQEAIELGLPLVGQSAAPQQAAQEQQVQQELAERQTFRNEVGTAPAPGAHVPPSVDPRDDAIQGYHEDRKRGVRQETAQLTAFDKLIVAASNGDQRVLITDDSWKQNYRG